MTANSDTSEKRKRKPARARILEAAETLFDAHGYHATSTDMIQGAADVSKSTLYRHFPTKENLFEIAMESGGRRFLKSVERLGTVQGLERFLTRFGSELLDALLTPHSLERFRLMIMESQRFPELGRSFYLAGPQGVIEVVEAYLAGAVAREEVRLSDPHVAAEQFVSMIRGDVHLRALLGVKTHLPKTERREHVARCVAAFLDMCGANTPS